MCFRVCDTFMLLPGEEEEGVRSPGAGVAHSCELKGMGAGNQTGSSRKDMLSKGKNYGSIDLDIDSMDLSGLQAVVHSVYFLNSNVPGFRVGLSPQIIQPKKSLTGETSCLGFSEFQM